jgi:hypothetical protein
MLLQGALKEVSDFEISSKSQPNTNKKRIILPIGY